MAGRRIHSGQFFQHRGFTLLELMVVVVILAIMAAVLVPSISRNAARDTADAANRLVMLINLAQQEAVLSSRIWQLVIDNEQASYRFQYITGMEFEDVADRPLAGEHSLENIGIDELRVNGRKVGLDEIVEVYLFPTGEQDPLQIVLGSGAGRYRVAMSVVGPAWIEPL